MSIKLTPRQQEILLLIQDTIEHTGFPPTRAEIASKLGFRSVNAAEDHLKALDKKGAIFLSPGTSRGIRLNPDFMADAGKSVISRISETLMQSSETLALPIIGCVAAGNPILAEQNIDTTLQLDPALFSSTPDYLLRVKGESMRDVGILDGDLLAVKRQLTAHNGQIIVARIDDEVTVKRFIMHKQYVELLPENPEFSPIRVESHQFFAIEGIAVGLVRTRPFH